jgi:hypothetical protein
MSHVRCITDTHVDAHKASWCGKPANNFEFRFADIDHAAMNGRHGGYLTVCPRCRAAVIAGLKNKTVEVTP